MKKFVGNVNGKSFDNEEDFNLAAREAIKSNDGVLSISSYISYVEDEKEKNENKVDFIEYSLANKTPEYVGNDLFYSKVSDDLIVRLNKATNKDKVIDTLNDYIKYYNKDLNDRQTTNNDIANDIKTLKGKIKSLEDQLKENEYEINDINARIEYYSDILKRVDTQKEFCVISNSKDLLSYLKKIGFTKD